MTLREDLPPHKAIFVAIGAVAALAAFAFAARSADGVRLGHVALGGFGLVLVVLGAAVREATLAKISWWVLLANVFAAAAALVLS